MNFLSGDILAGKGGNYTHICDPMAGNLGIPVIVEGVETQEQRDFSQPIGCDYVQGYYYAKPMPLRSMRGSTYTGLKNDRL